MFVGNRGNATISSSSVSEGSIGEVGLAIDAADDIGSIEGALEFIDGTDVLAIGHLGGERDRRNSRLWRGVVSWSGIMTGDASVSRGDPGLDKGDLVFASDPFLSRPPSNATFLKDPFRLRDFFCWSTADIDPAARPSSGPSGVVVEIFSLEFARRMGNREKILPDKDRL